MKTKNLRTAIAVAAFAVLSIGLVAGIGFGTMSGFGWETISALCPLGALTTMIAAKTVVPRAVVSLVVMGLLVLVVGRAFCGWLCPVPVLERARAFFRSPKKRTELAQAKHDEMVGIAKSELGCAEEAGDGSGCARNCATCAEKRTKLDSRHYVLGGALLSTAIFGFPVFCLVCPIGLTFATFIGLWHLFQFNETSWGLVIFPAILALETVFLRKWCTKICPVSALVSLVASANRTLRPHVRREACLRSSGIDCRACVESCPEQVDPHSARIPECSKCGACVEACPAQAIDLKLLCRR